MFETALVESSHLLRTRNRAPALLSVATQAVILAAILAYPLLRPGTLVARHYDLTLARRIPMPPPTPVVIPQPTHVRLVTTAQPTLGIAPPATPTTTHPVATPSPEPPSTTGFHMEGPGVDSGVPAIFGNNAPVGPHIGVSTGSGPGSASAGSRVGTGGRPNISTGVSAGLLLAPIQPIYPAIAKAAHQSGLVVVEATISPAGKIESAHATSGPATLQNAAVEAVRSARYRPFLLNGQPTEVTATFHINFKLSE